MFPGRENIKCNHFIRKFFGTFEEQVRDLHVKTYLSKERVIESKVGLSRYLFVWGFATFS
jgi:hypothetical protein